MEERLQKILARAGLGSRRECEKIILQGRVTVNGKLVTKLGTKVNPYTSTIHVDGEKIPASNIKYRYLILYKPRGYVTSTDDPQGRPTIINLLPPLNELLQPVGRLDFNSEGIILFTNHGELAHRIMHPSFGLEKEYLVKISGKPDAETLNKLISGIRIQGHLYKCKSYKIMQTKRTSKNTWLSIILTEGKNREIRKIFWKLRHPVSRLIRIRIGPVHVGNLQPAHYRFLSDTEIRKLKRMLSMQP